MRGAAGLGAARRGSISGGGGGRNAGVGAFMYGVGAQDFDGTVALRTILESQKRIEAALEGLAVGQKGTAASLEELRAHLQGGQLAVDPSPSKQSGGVEGERSFELNTVDVRWQVDAGGADVALAGGLQPSRPVHHRSAAFTQLAGGLAAQHSALALPATWPACVKARPGLQLGSRDVVREGSLANSLLRLPTAAEEAARQYMKGASLHLHHNRGPSDWLWRMLRDSGSPLHLAILMLSLLVLVHDLVVIPLILAWDMTPEGYFQVAVLASASFWTLEAGANMIRSRDFDVDAHLEPLLPSACRYLRTWFLLDGAVVGCDWLAIGLSLSPGQDKSGAVRLAKLARVFRVAGAVRAMRLLSLMQISDERLMSNHAREVMALVWCALAALWSCHIVACGWFAVGTYFDTNTGKHWVDMILSDPNGVGTPFLDLDLGHQYLSCFTFSVQQLTLLGTNIPPTNLAEELYQVSTLFVGLVFGSLLVSTLSARFVEFQASRKERTDNIRLLRRYLVENMVAPRLASHVLEQANGRLVSSAWLQEDAVPVLGTLSDALLSKLRRAICGSHLIAHPLLRLFEAMDEAWFGQLVNDAVSMTYLSPGDDLFAASCLAATAYRVVGGSLYYSQDPKSSPVRCEVTQVVEVGAVVAESALWCEWTHVGTMSAKTPTKAIAVRAEIFLEVLQRHRTIWDIAQAYGRAYLQRLRAAAPPLRDWPNDLQVPATDFEVLVYDMPHEISRVIAQNVLESRWGLRPKEKRARELWEEVESGKSVLIHDEHGQVLRVTSVVTLQIMREDDGRTLWQLGRFRNGVGEADLATPGVKRDKGEPADAALDRLVRSKMPQLAGRIQVHGLREESTEEKSRGFHMNTHYLRTVYLATFRGELEAPICESIGMPVTSLGTSTSHFSRTSGSRLSGVGVRHVNSGGCIMPVPEKFRTCPVFTLDHGSKKRGAYAWLLREDVDELQTPVGQEVLSSWMGSLLPPPSDFDDCSAAAAATACGPLAPIEDASPSGDEQILKI